jgi:hypothetical protein
VYLWGKGEENRARSMKTQGNKNGKLRKSREKINGKHANGK